MTLAFGATVTLGSLRYDRHATGLRLQLGLAPRAGTARITLPPQVRVDAEPGDDVVVLLDGEEPDVATFGGVVLRVDRGLDRTTVVAGDALARLAAIRPGTTFQQQRVADVVGAMADAAGIPTSRLDADTDLLTYVADQGRTALEHTAILAGWAGAVATSDADGSLRLLGLPTGPADLALRHGRELAALEVRQRQPAPDLVLTGLGPAGNVSAPDAHLETVAALPDGAPDAGDRTIRAAAPALRTPDGVTAATTAAATRNASSTMRATCWLQPGIRPGASVEIADATQPGGAGPWFVTSVVHDLGPRGAGSTRLAGQALADGGGLLAGLLGAIGGLP